MFPSIAFIYFDLDDTLLDFSSASKRAFISLMAYYQLDYSEMIHQTWKRENHRTWQELESGIIDARELRQRRFRRFLDALEWDAPAPFLEMNHQFISFLIQESEPMPFAQEIIPWLSKKIPLGILSNGLREAQRPRLFQMHWMAYFKEIIISDEVNLSKPQLEIFQLACQRAGKFDIHSILMVGDNPFSDILGASLAGMRTIWLNPTEKPTPEGIQPDLTITSLEVFKSLFP